MSEKTLRPLRLKLFTLYVAAIVSEKLSVEKSKSEIDAVTAAEPDNVPCAKASTDQSVATAHTKIDPKTGQAKEQNPDFLKTGDISIVHITPTRPMVIEPVKDIPQLGRFAIRDMGTTVAAGMCVKVEEK